MDIEHHTTVISVLNFCNKVHRTVLLERQGYRPQVHIETLIAVPGHDGLRLQSKVVLRVPQAIEVAHALLAAAESYYSSSFDDSPATVKAAS